MRDIFAIKVFNITADEVNQRINTSELKAIIDNAPPLQTTHSTVTKKMTKKNGKFFNKGPLQHDVCDIWEQILKFIY